MPNAMPWFRTYSEMIGDEKFAYLSELLKLPKAELIGIWTVILCIANKSPIRGSLLLTNKIPYTIDSLAVICGIDRDTMDNTLQAFTELEMITSKLVYDDTNEYIPPKVIWSVINWDKRQFSSDLSTERVRKYRSEHETTLKQPSNNEETAPETETYTETETETEQKHIHNQNSGSIELTQPIPNLTAYKLHEKYVGLVVPMVKEKLDQLVKDYPFEWIEEAYKIAVDKDKRNVAYVDGILKRWKANGKAYPVKHQYISSEIDYQSREIEGKPMLSPALEQSWSEWDKQVIVAAPYGIDIDALEPAEDADWRFIDERTSQLKELIKEARKNYGG